LDWLDWFGFQVGLVDHWLDVSGSLDWHNVEFGWFVGWFGCCFD
jgi:hypothetical protein